MAANNNQIPLFYVYQFSSNIQLKLQQKGSVLRSCVMTGSHVGAQASPVDQFAPIIANKVVGRFNPMPRTDAGTDRRWVFPQDYDVNQQLDTFDKLRLLIDPMSSYVQNAANALGRSMDIEILNGITGTNFTGNLGATSVPLAVGGTVVSVQQGAASPTNLTVAKIRAAKKALMAAFAIDFTERPEIYCAINAANHDSLLAEMQVISTDFNETPVLGGDGFVQRFMGVNFVHTELLSTGQDDQAGTSTAVPMWVKSGVYCGIWEDIVTRISQRDDLQGVPYQAYVKGTFGATRLEEKKVVQIWCR